MRTCGNDTIFKGNRFLGSVRFFNLDGVAVKEGARTLDECNIAHAGHLAQATRQLLDYPILEVA